MVRLVFRPYTQISTNDLHVSTAIELPSEFPLTSPYSSIVHHLSGPTNMLLLIPFTEDHGWMMLPLAVDMLILTFVTRYGFSTRRLAYVIDSLVRVSRRVCKSRFDRIA
jgi:hypothetical protein